MMKKTSWATIGRISIVVVIVAAIFVGRYRDAHNPFDDVVFREDLPGASGRYVTFTPILRGSAGFKVGPEVGADFGVLRFDDWDGDGLDEAIIETDVPFWSGGEHYHASRTVLKFTQDADTGLPALVEIHHEVLTGTDGHTPESRSSNAH